MGIFLVGRTRLLFGLKESFLFYQINIFLNFFLSFFFSFSETNYGASIFPTLLFGKIYFWTMKMTWLLLAFKGGTPYRIIIKVIFLRFQGNQD